MIAANPQPPAVNSKALLWTIVVHALLLLLFFFFRYGVPVVTTDIGNGLEVNLGSSETGSGNDQPMSTEPPSAYTASVVYKNVAAKADVPKNMLRTDDPNAPNANMPDGAKNNTTPGTDNNKNATPPTPKYSYQGETGKGGNEANQNVKGTNEGITSGPGDQGVKGGTPGAANYTGVPGSGGIGHNLIGRSITPSKFEAEFREGGKVVIHVTVNRDGSIVNKLVKSSSSPQLTKIALDKLNHAKFSPSTGTDPQQFGDVTIIFKAR